MMQVVIDGYIFSSQTHGGVSRIFSAIIPHMCAIDSKLEIDLVTRSQHRQQLPLSPQVSHRTDADYTVKLSTLRRFRGYIEPQLNYRLTQLATYRNLRDGGGKIWHSSFYRLPPLWRGPIVMSVYDMAFMRFPDLFSTPKNRWFAKNMRQCIEQADSVICISAATKDDVLRFTEVDESKVSVVPLAPSPAFTFQQADRSDALLSKQPFILHIGNRSRNKNFNFLLRAFAKWEGHKQFKLIVIGKPWNIHERALIDELQVESNVQLIHHVNDDALCDYYNQAAAFVYPSIYEGFGLPLLEAMACGCPLVASHIPSTTEVAGDIPIYFDPTSIDELCTALSKAVNNGRSSQKAMAGLEHVKQYSWERTAAETLNIYRQLC